MRFLLSLIILTILISCSSEGAEQIPKSPSLQQGADTFYLNTFESIGMLPGFSIAIVNKDVVLYQKGFGYADVENELEATSETNYYIAGATKPFSSLLAAILDDEGLISLDDPINKYLPETIKNDRLKTDEIIIRDLLSQTAPISNRALEHRLSFSGEYHPDSLNQLLEFTSRRNTPSGKFADSHVGYLLYRIIAESVLEEKWQDLLDRKIFEPLSMTHTSAYMSKADSMGWILAKPYRGFSSTSKRTLYLQKSDNTMTAAGGIISTTSDMSKWLQVQLGKGMLNGSRIFSEKIMTETQKMQVESTSDGGFFLREGYSLGWYVGKYLEEKVYWQFGEFPGLHSHVSFMPEKNIGVVVFVNEEFIGYDAMNLFASYAYDWLLDIENIEGIYQQKAISFKEELNKTLQSIRADLAEKRSREWNLLFPREEYEGTYEHDQYGSLVVTQKENEFYVQMGNLHCDGTPYSRQNSMRVELLPGSPTVIRYEMSEDSMITGIHYWRNFYQKQGVKLPTPKKKKEQ